MFIKKTPILREIFISINYLFFKLYEYLIPKVHEIVRQVGSVMTIWDL